MSIDSRVSNDVKLRVLGGAVVLVAVITYVRFCGAVSLPPRGEAPPIAAVASTPTQAKSSANPAVYRTYLDKDATLANVRVPTIEDMSRKLNYRSDEARHVLEAGMPAIELAGLRLKVEHSNDSLVLRIDNRTGADVAYLVTTQPAPKFRDCNSARSLPFDALVLAKDSSEVRTECTWHDNISLIVTKVETLELSPLGAYYIHLLPPRLLGIDDRISRGHRWDGETCSAVMSQSVRAGVAKGEIGWRDLVDFFARHRCQTYLFPSNYRAFKSDNERPIPYVDSGN